MNNAHQAPLNNKLIRNALVAFTFLFGTALTAQAQVPAPDESANGWVEDDTFGLVYQTESGWLYTEDHGWLFEIEGEDGNSWYFNPRAGWWWIGRNAYPWIYSNDEDAWLFFQERRNLRRFWHIVFNEWIDGNQMDNIEDLVEVFETIYEETVVDDELVDNLIETLEGIFEAAGMSEDERVLAFLASFERIFADDHLNRREFQRTAHRLRRILNTAEATDEDIAAVQEAVEAIIEAARPSEELRQEARDIARTIVEEFREGRDDDDGEEGDEVADESEQGDESETA